MPSVSILINVDFFVLEISVLILELQKWSLRVAGNKLFPHYKFRFTYQSPVASFFFFFEVTLSHGMY